MKFKIRYADQIVGLLTIIAIAALVLVVFLLGSKQRWFAKDYLFQTEFDSGTGLNNGMAIQYKGFTIGKVKSVNLNKNDKVDVEFYIQDTYYDRAREGSVVELSVSPIGLGNQFLFHPGNGVTKIPEGGFIPRMDSDEGQARIRTGMVTIQKKEDSISNLLTQANTLIVRVNSVLAQVDEAFAGTGDTSLTKTMLGVEQTLTNVAGITGTLDRDLAGIIADIQKITSELGEEVANPTGLIPALIDPEGALFGSLNEALSAAAGTIENLEKTTALLPAQIPQIAGLVGELLTTLQSAQDVLTALSNNPLLKNGVPERVSTESGGTSPRNIQF
ncbi:MlaD family protein [Brucepastera parasyntrophica]|uniref:MlaD family protein n=1 Tax=Brucepastera parasyntrophica TaxID=2880008 RepID=UPI00210CA269|nr:MlaD family protein [Brucepastera parasyntrophica]ULQ59056.1 MlaD family protein [Brucepastera parasyntrophica]